MTFSQPTNLLESVGAEGAGLDAGGARPLALVHGHVGFAGPDEDGVRIVFVCFRKQNKKILANYFKKP